MISIAIDGPAGAGKSSLSKKLAANLGLCYVDTGAIYRTVAVKLIKCGITEPDEKKVEEILKDTSLDIKYDGEKQVMILDNEDVTHLIRTEEVSMMASKSSALPCVRAFLLQMQREMAKKFSVVMDGRDIGTVVLPNADVKIFLTASPEKRAKRRYDELIAKGESADYDAVYKDMLERDYNDTHRKVSPLKAANDAVIVDTSDIDFNASLELLIKTVKDRM